jgi:hypothetical protein
LPTTVTLECRCAAATIRVLASPARLRVLVALEPGPLRAGELAEAAGLGPRHNEPITQLRAAGLTESLHRGRATHYALTPRGRLLLAVLRPLLGREPR